MIRDLALGDVDDRDPERPPLGAIAIAQPEPQHAGRREPREADLRRITGCGQLDVRDRGPRHAVDARHVDLVLGRIPVQRVDRARRIARDREHDLVRPRGRQPIARPVPRLARARRDPAIRRLRARDGERARVLEHLLAAQPVQRMWITRAIACGPEIACTDQQLVIERPHRGRTRWQHQIERIDLPIRRVAIRTRHQPHPVAREWPHVRRCLRDAIHVATAHQDHRITVSRRRVPRDLRQRPVARPLQLFADGDLLVPVGVRADHEHAIARRVDEQPRLDDLAALRRADLDDVTIRLAPVEPTLRRDPQPSRAIANECAHRILDRQRQPAALVAREHQPFRRAHPHTAFRRRRHARAVFRELGVIDPERGRRWRDIRVDVRARVVVTQAAIGQHPQPFSIEIGCERRDVLARQPVIARHHHHLSRIIPALHRIVGRDEQVATRAIDLLDR